MQTPQAAWGRAILPSPLAKTSQHTVIKGFLGRLSCPSFAKLSPQGLSILSLFGKVFYLHPFELNHSTMIITVLLSLFISLIYCIVLLFVGKILQRPHQLRKFLGFHYHDEKVAEFTITAYWIEKIGKLVVIIAFLEVFYQIFLTMSTIANMM